MSRVSCLLVGFKIWRHFFNTLTADHMYSCYNWQKISQEVQTQLSFKPSRSSETFIAFWRSTWSFKLFEKKITFIASIYPKLLIPKYVVTWMPLNSCFRTPFGNESVNGSKTQLKSARQHFYVNVPLILKKLSCVLCLLGGSEILGDFFNTLRANHMCFSHNWQKLPQRIQTQLFSKPSNLLKIVLHFENLH